MKTTEDWSQFRPWKSEEVPLDAWYRVKNGGNGGFKLIKFYYSDKTIYVVTANIKDLTPEHLFCDYEHSNDGGKTWKLCGVEE